MSDNIQELAKLGDITAISKLVESAIANNVAVKAKIHHGATLELNVQSSNVLDSQFCNEIIVKTLNDIQPAKITTVMIYGTSKGQKWSRFLTLKNGQYRENAAVVKSVISFILATFVCLIGWSIFSPKPKTETTKECLNRVTEEIMSRKKASGETLIKDKAEIEAYGEEFKRKCNVVF